MPIFTSLNRWASSQQENFLTEVFSELLSVIVKRDFDAFALVFERLSGLDYSKTDQHSFIVSTQVATDAGYPD